MHERSLPASPNWYCSRSSDVNDSGLLGVGAKNVIFLIDVSASSCRVTGELEQRADGHCGSAPAASAQLSVNFQLIGSAQVVRLQLTEGKRTSDHLD